MAAISLPERGQPLDVNYIYEMVSQINSIENRIAIRNTSVSTVNANSDTTSNIKFYAEELALTTTEAKANATDSVTFTFPRFKFTPVVTASIFNRSGSTPGDDVIFTLRNITTSSATVVVRFNSSGKVDLRVNLIAIGIPN
jgi:hypothetical protein